MTRFAWIIPVLLAVAVRGASAADLPLLSAVTEAAQWRDRIGQPVYTADGVANGILSALITDPVSGRPVGAVVRRTWWFGLASREAVVPADQVATVNTDVVVLRWTSADLDAAPAPQPQADDRRVVSIR